MKFTWFEGGCLLLMLILFCKPISKVNKLEEAELISWGCIRVVLHSQARDQMDSIAFPTFPLQNGFVFRTRGFSALSLGAGRLEMECRAAFLLFCGYLENLFVFAAMTSILDSIFSSTGSMMVLDWGGRYLWFVCGLWPLIVNDLEI